MSPSMAGFRVGTLALIRQGARNARVAKPGLSSPQIHQHTYYGTYIIPLHAICFWVTETWSYDLQSCFVLVSEQMPPIH